MKKVFALALLAAVALVGCNPDNGGGTILLNLVPSTM